MIGATKELLNIQIGATIALIIYATVALIGVATILYFQAK
jgi:hypothetical protein